MRKKWAFIFIVILTVAIGLIIYVEKHGTATVTGAGIDISAGQAVLVDGKTGKILYERCADQKAYPASTTKIMTALVVIEALEKNKSPIEQMVVIPKCAVGVEGSSLYLQEGERISVEDLLYGLMLVSGNDAAETLAQIIGGNREVFVDMMNDKAGELGCKNTNFTNPHGLFDENHYTTARDMAIISRAAMKHPFFREIVATEKWKSNRSSGEYKVFYNKNRTVTEYEGGTGIKIGYTTDSGRTLVASAERDGKCMLCVVMSDPNWFNDAYRLMDYGFSCVK